MAGKSVMVGGMLCEEWSAPCVVCGGQTLMVDLDFEARMHSRCSDQLWAGYAAALERRMDRKGGLVPAVWLVGGARAEESGKLAD